MSEEITTIITEILELNGKLERMMTGIEVVKEKQDEMALDILKIKDAVYDPDEGIYARIRSLEAWKASSSRMLWMLITTIVGLGSATIWTLLING